MQLVYNGPHPEVVVDELDTEQVITAGQPVEIPDDLAARLLEQDTWNRDVSSLTRAELNAQASAAGVEEPHRLPSKQAVVDAIDAASSDPVSDEATSTETPADAGASADDTKDVS